MIRHLSPQEAVASVEPSRRAATAMLVAGTALLSIGILAPQVPQTRILLPEAVTVASDKAFGSVLGSVLTPMITQDKR